MIAAASRLPCVERTTLSALPPSQRVPWGHCRQLRGISRSPQPARAQPVPFGAAPPPPLAPPADLDALLQQQLAGAGRLLQGGGSQQFPDMSGVQLPDINRMQLPDMSGVQLPDAQAAAGAAAQVRSAVPLACSPALTAVPLHLPRSTALPPRCCRRWGARRQRRLQAWTCSAAARGSTICSFGPCCSSLPTLWSCWPPGSSECWAALWVGMPERTCVTSAIKCDCDGRSADWWVGWRGRPAQQRPRARRRHAPPPAAPSSRCCACCACCARCSSTNSSIR